MAVANLTADVLRSFLDYDPATGFFRWKVRTPDQFCDGEQTREHVCARWNAMFGGRKTSAKKAGSGHLTIRVEGRLYRAHRLVWLFVYGEWPASLIDHANGDPADNRVVNLRLASFAENARNGRMKSFNTSGLKGVSWAKRERLWRATISVNWRHVGLGYFDCPAAAHLAYVVGADKLHGEFARFD